MIRFFCSDERFISLMFLAIWLCGGRGNLVDHPPCSNPSSYRYWKTLTINLWASTQTSLWWTYAYLMGDRRGFLLLPLGRFLYHEIDLHFRWSGRFHAGAWGKCLILYQFMLKFIFQFKTKVLCIFQAFVTTAKDANLNPCKIPYFVVRFSSVVIDNQI